MSKTRGTSLRLLDELISSFGSKSNLNVIINTLRQGLYDLGFDIFHEFSIQSYNQNVVESSKNLLPLNEYGKTSTHSILIGNTRHLWPIFINELTVNGDKWKNEENPLNEYTLNNIDSICHKYLKENNIDYTLRFTFEMDKDKLIAFQRLCDESNLARLDKNSYLCIHKTYGPWMALRALIVLNNQYQHNSNLQSKYSLNDICTYKEQQNVIKQWKEIQAVLYNDTNDNKDNKEIMESWRYWLKLRDCYDIGKNYRYSDDQILYHYTTDLNILKNICQWKYD